MTIQQIHSTVICKSDLCLELLPGFPGSPWLLHAAPQKTLIHQSRAPTHLTEHACFTAARAYETKTMTEVFVLLLSSCRLCISSQTTFLLTVSLSQCSLSLLLMHLFGLSLSASCSRSVFSVLLVVSLFWGCGLLVSYICSSSSWSMKIKASNSLFYLALSLLRFTSVFRNE